MAVAGQRVAFLVATEGIEEVELTEPWRAVEEAGGHPSLISSRPGQVQAFNHLDRSRKFDVDQTAAQAEPGEFAALVLPGGVANGDQLRMDKDSQSFVRAFFDQGKPVAVICHGPWILTEVDVLHGRRMTSWPSLQTDLRNAGATWVDEEVVVDRSGNNTLITSRKPDDLPAFNRELLAAV